MTTIRSVEFIGLRSELAAPATFSWGSAHSRNVGLVQVTTSDGVTGWGETSVTFPLWSLEERQATVTSGLAPMATGKACGSLAEIAALVADLEQNMARLRLLWSPVGVSSAISALELALLDALGRAQGVPTWQLLGGQPQQLPLYAVGFGGRPEQMAEQAQAALDEGYAAVKIRLGFGRQQDLDLLRTMRAALGPDATVYADVNMGWDLPTAREMAPLLQEFSLGWLEEPLSRDETADFPALGQAAHAPIAAGENCYSRAEVVALAESGRAEIVMPDLARCGGLLAGIAGARAAIDGGRAYSTHHYASDLGFAAMLAVGAVLGPSAPILRDVSPWPLREQILSEPVTIAQGRATTPIGPGLAPEPDPDVIERNRVL